MATNPIEKYKGQYRIRCEIDKNTNDYPRELKYNKETKQFESMGEYVHNDVYIETKYGKIYWVDRGTYEAWVGDLEGTNRLQKFKKLIKKYKKDIIRSLEGEGEGTFVFKESILEDIVSDMGGGYLTKIKDGAFSDKNLEYDDYDIPEEESKMLAEIAENNNWNMQTYSRNYKEFLFKKLKLEKYTEETQKLKYWQALRNQKLKAKEYIHKNGYWDEFLEFCKQ